MNDSNLKAHEQKRVVLYGDVGDGPQTEVTYFDETLWMPQRQMAELFGVGVPAINKHLKNIFETKELDEASVISKMEITASDGKVYLTQFYNLDAIIAVGYRVNSSQATRFRIWATKVLKEFIIKGFVLDDDRLKQSEKVSEQDYFRELLQRVRSIRASEQRIWRQVTDIFEACSIDYDKGSKTARDFFATVQNLFHYAITGKTAAEIVYTSADRTKPHMGLTTWKNAPDGRVNKPDVTVAKNYLTKQQIEDLERNVTAYFDYIEGLILRHRTFTMIDLSNSVVKFLEFNEYKILEGKGSISHKQATKKAHEEYDVFNKTQKYKNDFDEFVEETKALSKSRSK